MFTAWAISGYLTSKLKKKIHLAIAPLLYWAKIHHKHANPSLLSCNILSIHQALLFAANYTCTEQYLWHMLHSSQFFQPPWMSNNAPFEWRWKSLTLSAIIRDKSFSEANQNEHKRVTGRWKKIRHILSISPIYRPWESKEDSGTYIKGLKMELCFYFFSPDLILSALKLLVQLV